MPATKQTTQDPLKTAAGKLDLLYFWLQLISPSEKLALAAGDAWHHGNRSINVVLCNSQHVSINP
jgi:hypothetical protein